MYNSNLIPYACTKWVMWKCVNTLCQNTQNDLMQVKIMLSVKGTKISHTNSVK